MVMRSPSKEKAPANLTSKFMSNNDQPVNCPFAWMHCWSNQSNILVISVMFPLAVCVICVWLSWRKGFINLSFI